MNHHIFLSYSRRDTEIMQRIRDSLRSAPLSVWTDEGIETGTRSWKRAIEDAILQAGCLVCILSPDSNQSEWVRAELEFADLHEKPIYLILARGDERSSVPFGFATMQWVDVRQNEVFEQRIQGLVETLRAKLPPDNIERGVQSSQPQTETLEDLIRLGNLAHYDDRHAEAIQHYTKALSKDPDNPALHLNRGTSYLEKQQYELAALDLQHAVELDSKNHDAFHRLGRALNAIGNDAEAVKAFTAAIAIQPSAKSHFERGNCRFTLTDYEGATVDYSETINLDHEIRYPSAYNNRAECWFLLGEFQKALTDFRQAIEIVNNPEMAKAGMAVTLFALQQQSAAYAVWQTLVQRDNKLTDIDYAGQKFNWAEPMIVQGQQLLAGFNEQ